MDKTRNLFKQLPLKYLVIIIMFLLFYGCVSSTSIRLYAGHEKPLSEIAILTTLNPLVISTKITKVDEYVKTKEEYWVRGVKYGNEIAGLVELLPGKHTITALFITSHSGLTKWGENSVEFYAKAGHVYEIYPVLHNHDDGYYFDIWDVTDELRRPELQKLSKRMEKVLKKNRINSSFDSASNKKIIDEPMKKLPGFGEKIKAQIIGMKGRQVDVEYEFNRYKPYVLAEGNDGKDYHIKISQLNGSVEEVLGIKVWTHRTIAFQPINSDTAYVGNKELQYKEMPDGSYEGLRRKPKDIGFSGR